MFAEADAGTSDTDALLLDEQLCFALYTASLAIQRLYRPILAEFGLTYPQFLVLLVLWEHDHVGVSCIGERLGLDSATVTPLLKRMERAELVRRQRSVDDERRVEIHLTDHGDALRAAVEAATESVRCAAAQATPDTPLLQRLLRDLPAGLAGRA